jgi:ribosomal protein S18 acetylase RimI-like enzyme
MSSTTLTFDELTADPDRLTAPGSTPDGTAFTWRLLRPDESAPLGRYFDDLSDAVRGMYGPHKLTAEFARTFCDELDYRRFLPFLAWRDGADPREICAYFLVQVGTREGDARRYVDHGEPLVDDECATLAPCVADAWQERGLGSALFPHVAASLRRLGRRRLVLWGGVRGDNPRAQHFYRKVGFRHVGNFLVRDVDNLDMVLDL